jgi:competence protein ComEA
MTTKSWFYFLLGLVSALFASGLIILISSQPRGDAIILAPSPTFSPIYVDISGEIYSPGIYALPAASRLEDVIILAGGLTDRADVSRINRAELLEDGDKIVIPSINSGDVSRGNNDPTSSTLDGLPININQATSEELEKLPGIGPEKAQEIIDFRNEYGNFTQIEEIMEVPGIGETTFEEIKDLITVN